MPLNGDLQRKSLYISLNSRAHLGDYHWGLIITDADNKSVLHHASNRNGPWIYEVRKASPAESMTLIILMRVDEVRSHGRAMDVIKSIPADGSPSQRTGEAFDCKTWVKDVLVALHEAGEIKLPTVIDALENKAVEDGLLHAPLAEDGLGATVLNDPLSK
ncbi:hypothetical protein TOPH_07652 [Tolypocladium ophioglossoides CBS 100239]|uniref:Uncharacterized protein n=1 Tax=Tolypocladium ophioglossoides (strain CBS 100239) TaxID=1163406 RepID=A0A0L0N0Z3_TOLOC|nr:hypothetical protein TOPH_07652 [Tolypocladium ophioglossoides CBS 100239]